MAFFCPIRIRGKKEKVSQDDMLIDTPISLKPNARSSVETLVRVGLDNNAFNTINGNVSQSTVDQTSSKTLLASSSSQVSKMVVLHDFTPCVDDELEVKRGQLVHVMYQENDWVYVVLVGEKNGEGFIPHSYCAPCGSQMATLALNVKKKMLSPQKSDTTHPHPPSEVVESQSSVGSEFQLPPHADFNSHNFMSGSTGNSLHDLSQNGSGSVSTKSTSAMSHHELSQISSPTSLTSHNNIFFHNQHPDHLNHRATNSSQNFIFNKAILGRFIVLYAYLGVEENDVRNVKMGEIVTLLNADDPDWSWVRVERGAGRGVVEEGFVPSAFIYPLHAVERQHHFQQQQMTLQKNIINQSTDGMGPHRFVSNSSRPKSMFVDSPLIDRSSNESKSRMHGPDATVLPSDFIPTINNLETTSTLKISQTNTGSLWEIPHGMSVRPEVGRSHFNNELPAAARHDGNSDGVLSRLQNQRLLLLDDRREVESTVNPTQPTTVLVCNETKNALVCTSNNVNNRQNMVGLPSISISSLNTTSTATTVAECSSSVCSQQQNNGNGVMKTSELIMLFDYKGEGVDDLSVDRGDWLHADLSHQSVDGWLWCFSPKHAKFGFVPRAYAKPPAMTSL